MDLVDRVVRSQELMERLSIPDAFRDLAHRLATEIAPPLDMAGCSARMLETVGLALAEHDAANA